MQLWGLGWGQAPTPACLHAFSVPGQLCMLPCFGAGAHPNGGLRGWCGVRGLGLTSTRCVLGVSPCTSPPSAAAASVCPSPCCPPAYYMGSGVLDYETTWVMGSCSPVTPLPCSNTPQPRRGACCMPSLPCTHTTPPAAPAIPTHDTHRHRHLRAMLSVR